jgi:outer membrane protein OmpA-like peptidoglycan-associated protein
MTRNHIVVALAALGFAGLAGCGSAPPPVAVVAPPPPPVVQEVVAVAPAPPPPRLVTVCDGVIMPGGHFKFPHEVEFDIGKATIKHTPATDAILQCLVDFMNTNKMVTKFEVDGHTDNAGDATANQALSQARADAIVGWMSSKGIEVVRLSSRGWGPNKPLVPNDSPDHMAQNRRVEFWVHELNGVAANKDSIALAMNPPAVATTAVVTTAAPAVGIGVAVPTVGVAVPTVGVAVPTATVAVPTGIAVGVTTTAPPKKK